MFASISQLFLTVTAENVCLQSSLPRSRPFAGRTMKSCQAVLGAGLGNAAAVSLANPTAELLLQSGKPDKAILLLDLVQKRISEPELLRELADVRARISQRQ